MSAQEFGPGHPEWCPNAPADDPGHCLHWWDCEPCHRCGDDSDSPNCDCPKHNPGLYDAAGNIKEP